MHKLERSLVRRHVLFVEHGRMNNKNNIGVFFSSLYKMQLSVYNYLLQYDGFRSVCCTVCGLMHGDRNNFSSLDCRHILSDTGCLRNMQTAPNPNEEIIHQQTFLNDTWECLVNGPLTRPSVSRYLLHELYHL